MGSTVTAGSAPKLHGHEQYLGVQALRFFAALMVVATHSTFYASERMGAPDIFWSRGARGVDIFFVISGFVMYISGRRLKNRPWGWAVFVERRLIRIVPLYWVLTTAKLAVMAATTHLVLHARFNPVSILCSYLFLPSTNVDGRIEPLLGVGWTLNFEMFFYAVFALALALRARIMAFVLPVLAVVASGMLLRQPNWPAAAFYLNDIVLEFALGMIVAVLVSRRLVIANSLLAMLCVAAGAALLLTGWLGPVKILGSGVPAAMVVYGIVSLEPKLAGYLPRGLVYLGAASYSLYLSHPLVAPVVPELLGRLGCMTPVLSVAASIALSVAVSCLVYRYLEGPMSKVLLSRVIAARADAVPLTPLPATVIGAKSFEALGSVSTHE